MGIDFDQLRKAFEVSWDQSTAYQQAFQEGNPALGQCYSTSRVIQLFFPEAEIVEGEIWTGRCIEKHFWSLLMTDGAECHIDLTWQQFPEGSVVKNWKVRERESLGDSQETVDRVNLLFDRVNNYIYRHNLQAVSGSNTNQCPNKRVGHLRRSVIMNKNRVMQSKGHDDETVCDNNGVCLESYPSFTLSSRRS